MKARAFLYRRPHDIDEAVALLGDNAGDAQVLAGGQSLMPTLNMRLSSPGMLVDINRIGALAGIADRGAAIRIGALERVQRVAVARGIFVNLAERETERRARVRR